MVDGTGAGAGAGTDPGLARERTRLAWRRTCLTVVLGGAVGLRLLPPVLGVAGLVLASLVLLGGAGLTVAAERRGRRLRQAPLDGPAVPGAGGLGLVLAAAVASVSALAVVTVLVPAGWTAGV